ncbi:MAG: hypothetical protein A2X83_01915 [Desulfuromonadales bacterium GWD2_54_10]|nr:MAG: hypothetical protein A2X83_01915 [Desulfuromonadales bacterium GWD2_54_10]
MFNKEIVMNHLVVFVMLAVFLGMTSLVDAADKKVIIGFKKGAVASEEDRHHKFSRAGGRVKRSHRIINAISGQLSEEEIEKLKNDPDVAYIEEDSVVGITEPTLLSTPLTQEYAESWGVARIGGNAAAAGGITGAGIKVAVLDSGIDYNHPELKGNYKGGYNFAYDNNDPFDDGYISHGTHIAGIIGARNNGTGVVGVAPEVSLYAVKVLGGMVMGDLSDILAGMEWAITNNMNIINMSIGAPIDSNAFKDVCDRAYQAGIIVVAAAGNTNSNTIEFPAAYDSVIAVGATDQVDAHPTFSNYGQKLELAAPGVAINSTMRGGSYGILKGTSQATAHVSGAAAILLAKGIADANGDGRVADDVRALLGSSAADLGDIGRDPYFGFGLVDLSKALTPQPVTYHYTVARTIGSRKDNDLTVALKPGVYTVEITNHGNIDLKIHAVDANCFKEIGHNKLNKRHEKHPHNYNYQSHDATISLQVAIGDSGSISFIPTGSPGSSADIVITSKIL